MGRRAVVAAFLLTLLVAGSVRASANPASDALRLRASNEVFNLDTVQALDTWRDATAADPEDGAAWRGLAAAILVHISLLRGTMTVDSYLGRVTTKGAALTPTPPELAREFDAAISRALAIGRRQAAAHPDDAQAVYELGATIGIRASYLAGVDGGMMAAFRSARDAYDAHERVLDLDARRADAGLVVGTYRYIVSALSLPLRWAAYIVGFGGGKERGIHLVEGAASYPGENQSDARIALLLLYTREGRFDEALGQLEVLRHHYPRNRLLWLEAGSTQIRAGRFAEAERTLDEGIRMLTQDARPRMLGEDALWYYRRGSARAGLGRYAATLAPLLDKEHGRLDWTRSALALDAHVRAMTSWPGAFTSLAGKTLKVLEAAALCQDGHLRLWPHRHGTDGFFASVIIRRP